MFLIMVDLVYFFRSPGIPKHPLPIVCLKFIIYTIIVECCMTFRVNQKSQLPVEILIRVLKFV